MAVVRKTKRAWTPADLKLLRSLAGKESVDKIARQLKRTPGAVRVRASEAEISLSLRALNRAKRKKKATRRA